jgi:hypothetical protein
MTETCCGNNIRRAAEELLRWWTHNGFGNVHRSLKSNLDLLICS